MFYLTNQILVLKSLFIKNYALIDDVSIFFKSGFTSITGETGAGKSILLGALALILGKRADFNILRDKTRKCVVEGQFQLNNIPIADFFVKNDLDFDMQTIIRREIVPSGRSRAFINDTPVNLELLRELSEKLVDIHSQHESLEIGKSVFQMKVLNDYINKPELVSKYTNKYDQLNSLKNEISKLTRELEQSKRDESYYRFQYEEIKSADLTDGEDEQLVIREKLLTHAEEVMQGLSFIRHSLNEGDNTLLDRLKEVKNWLSKIEEFHPGISDLLQRTNSVYIEMEDISGEINNIDVLTHFDQNELTKISNRLNEIYKLQQKHNLSSVSELLDLQKEYEEKLSTLNHNEEHLNQLKLQLDKIKAEANEIALQIHDVRRSESTNLANSIKTILLKLGMKNAGFAVKVEKINQLNQHGIDHVSFLFNANSSNQLKEISSIASGGELSRLMLAIKSQITTHQLLPTVVFDEIDSGVSGEIAGKVGNIINEMAKHHQVIAITHLPQIAAKSHQHFKVFKSDDSGNINTQIIPLDKNGRVEEIAKLLSDEKVSDAAISTAKELLKI